MGRIFISYRREDSDIWVSRLVDELRKHFPPEQVFQDIGSIDPGADFVEALEKALNTAGVMLVVIGKHWLSATDKQGRRRLDMPGDFVRQEIAESLRRPGVGVFPLLVNGAEMPAEEELPEPLKPLHRRQAFELTVRHWPQDVAQLVQTLKRAPGFSDDRRADEDFTLEEVATPKARDPTSNKRSLSWALQIIAGLMISVALYWNDQQERLADIPAGKQEKSASQAGVVRNDRQSCFASSSCDKECGDHAGECLERCYRRCLELPDRAP